MLSSLQPAFGENSVRIRARIADQLGWLGVTLDEVEISVTHA